MDILQLPPVLSKASSKDKPWETHKMVADIVQQTFQSSTDSVQLRRSERMSECAPYLIFRLFKNPENSEEIRHKLRYAEFCRVRLCPTCMWRKSMAWRARFYQAWPRILKEYPKARYFHLVLTVPNCEIFSLRETLDQMNKAWNRMLSRKTWPALGFLRSMEITRNARSGLSHPHIHALMMVHSTYFSKHYMNRDDWREYWLSAMGIPLESNCIHPFVRAVKGEDNLAKAVLEVSKYAVKMKSMEGILRTKPGKSWFLELDKQLSGTKSVTLGGVIKDLMRSDDITDEELLQQEEELMGEFLRDVRYDWFSSGKNYLRTEILTEIETQWWNRQEEKWREKRSIQPQPDFTPDVSQKNQGIKVPTTPDFTPEQNS